MSNFRKSLLLPGAYIVITGALVWLFFGVGEPPGTGDETTIDVSLLQKLLTAGVAAMYLAYARYSRFPWSFAFCLAFSASLGVELVAPYMTAQANLCLHHAVFSVALLPGLLFARQGMKSFPRLLTCAGLAIACGQAAGVLPLFVPDARQVLANGPLLYRVGAVAGLGIQLWAAYVLVRSNRVNATMLMVSSICYMWFLSLYTLAAVALPLEYLPSDSPEVVRTLALLLLPTALFGDFFKSTRHGGAQLTNDPDPAFRDVLTGLPNRRALDTAGAKLFRQSVASHKPVSILMLDIDHFKQVNDTYGHQAGDAVLSVFGNLISDQVRSTDFVARFGGEEFIAVLPGAPLAPAIRLAERMRLVVQDTPVSQGPHQLKITTSIGVATAFPGDKLDFRAIVERADKNLYRAKRAGRNRVTSAGPDMEF